MRTSQHHILPTIIIFLAVWFLGGCASSIRMCPDYPQRKDQIKTIAIMPPEVEAIKITASGDNQMLFDLIPKLQYMITDQARLHLEKKDLSIKVLDISKDALKEDAELRTDLGSVQETFARGNAESIKKAYKKGGDKNFNYSMDAEVNPFADRTDADALIFVRGTAAKKTKGAITKDYLKTFAIGMATAGQSVVLFPKSFIAFQIAVVDGNTGDVLWYNLGGIQDCSPDNYRCIKRIVERLLKKFPDDE